ncbi:MAG: hypothetical protein JW889_14355 [Verrucomicrobia bacterium]|nr:hypothetical protein [Verrucomicrobiota bacterium]
MRATTALIGLTLLTLLAVGANAATQYSPGKNPPGCTLKVEDPAEYRARTTEGMNDDLKRTILERKRAGGCPNLPDLDITYIERTPRYPRYHVSYGEGGTNPHLEGDQIRMQRWPIDGEAVTFSGHVINKGLAPSVETSWVMTLDGRPIGQGTIPALQPLDEAIVSARWPWQSGRHQVRLMVDMQSLNNEITKTNNNVADCTDAYSFFWTVRDVVHAEQDAVRNIYGSYSSEDWHRSVMEWMNKAFEGCVWPLTPNGIPARLRIDYYWVSPRPWVDHDAHPLSKFTDGTWPHYPGGRFEFEGKTPEEIDRFSDEVRQSVKTNAVYDPNIPGQDRALPHELSHQLGLIDVYHMNVPAQLCQVKLPDGRLLRDVLPDKAGRSSWERGLMIGGSIPQVWSEWQAYGLVLDYGKRRGFFGEMLLDMPAKSSIRVLDAKGKPVAGAELTIYQRQGEAVPDKPVHQGTADANGVFRLDGKPFGDICVVGTNGSLLCRVEDPRSAQVDWAWTQIDEFNLAKWRGQTDHAVIDLHTQLGQ